MNIKKASVDFINTLFDLLDTMKESPEPRLVCVGLLSYPYYLSMNRDVAKLTKVVDGNTHSIETLCTASMHGDFTFGEMLDAYINELDNNTKLIF